MRLLTAAAEDPSHINKLNQRLSLFRLFPSLTELHIQIAFGAQPVHRVTDYIQSATWKAYTQAFHTLCASSASMPNSKTRVMLSLSKVPPSLMADDGLTLLVGPLSTLPNLAVKARLELSGEYPPAPEDTSSSFPMAWASSVHLTAPSTALHLVAQAKNVTSLHIYQRRRDTRHAYGLCLKNLANTLEDLAIFNDSFDAQEGPELPSELPKLRANQSAGSWVSSVAHLFEMVRMPELRSMFVKINENDRERLFMTHPVAGRQLRALDSATARRRPRRRCPFMFRLKELALLRRHSDIISTLLQREGFSLELNCDGLPLEEDIGMDPQPLLLDTRLVSTELPPEWRASVQYLTVAIQSNTVSRPEGGDKIVLGGLEELFIDIGQDTREWSTHIAYQFFACLSAPQLQHIALSDQSDAQVLGRILHFLAIFLPLWPKLESIGLSARQIANQSVERDLSTLQEACISS